MKKWFALIAFMLISACKSSDTELKAYIAKVKSSPVKQVEPLPAFHLYVIAPKTKRTEKRNPFTPQSRDAIDRRDFKGHFMLKKTAISDMNFVGKITQDERVYGFVELPEGKVIRVHIGDVIGVQRAVITAISDNEIAVREASVNGAGKRKRIINHVHHASKEGE